MQAAELQGKHLEMANKLFETQDSWKDVSQTIWREFSSAMLRNFGLEEEKFKTDMTDPKTVDLIKSDF